MSKKNIIKLNEQYFSCNPINENFEATTEIKSKVDTAERKKLNALCKTNPDNWSDETRMKCNNMKKRRSKKRRSSRRPRRSKKRSKKYSEKTKEGFCAGNTCLTEDNLKSLINLLKKLELKK